MNFQVEFYEQKDGTQPVRDFILSLDKKMIAKILDTIKLLQDNVYQLREPYSKHIDDGIFEIMLP